MTSPALRQLIADLSLYRDLYVERERDLEISMTTSDPQRQILLIGFECRSYGI